MADLSLKKLIQLINNSADVELQQSAIRVAGALCSKKDSDLVKSLLKLLDHENAEVRSTVIEALGNLGTEEALEAMLKLIEQGGSEVEVAVEAASRMGRKGPKAVTNLMSQVMPHLRRRIAGALAHGATDNAILGAMQTLMDPEAKVVEAAARSLSSEVPTLTDKQRQSLTEHLIETLNDKKLSLSNTSKEAMLRILGELQTPEAEATFWNYLKIAQTAEKKAAALDGLGAIEWKKTDAKVKTLFECAAQPGFIVVSRALLMLQPFEAKGKYQKHWEELLNAHDIAARRQAIEKLSDVDSISVARAMVPLLNHSHRGLQQDALQALQNSNKGRQALIEALLDAENADDAWFIARAVKPRANEITPSQRESILKSAYQYQDDHDPRAKAFWFLLREQDDDQTNSDIEAKGKELRKKKKYEQSLNYYRLLTRDPSCAADVRFEQAAIGLKLSEKDTGLTAREQDPCLDQFTRLQQNTNFDLSTALSKAKWLNEEDLFYLGFHFAESVHKPAKELGGELLRMVVKKTPRTKLGKEARSKLKAEGLAAK